MKTARMALNVGLCNNIGKCKVKKSQLRGLGLWRRPALKSQKYGKPTYMYGVILHAHPVRGESHNQRNTTGEVATVATPEDTRDGMSQHFCSLARPDVRRKCPVRPVGAKPQIIFRPVARNIT